MSCRCHLLCHLTSFMKRSFFSLLGKSLLLKLVGSGGKLHFTMLIPTIAVPLILYKRKGEKEEKRRKKKEKWKLMTPQLDNRNKTGDGWQINLSSWHVYNSTESSMQEDYIKYLLQDTYAATRGTFIFIYDHSLSPHKHILHTHRSSNKPFTNKTSNLWVDFSLLSVHGPSLSDHVSIYMNEHNVYNTVYNTRLFRLFPMCYTNVWNVPEV